VVFGPCGGGVHGLSLGGGKQNVSQKPLRLLSVKRFVKQNTKVTIDKVIVPGLLFAFNGVCAALDQFGLVYFRRVLLRHDQASTRIVLSTRTRSASILP
jgi:hypothetical protein